MKRHRILKNVPDLKQIKELTLFTQRVHPIISGQSAEAAQSSVRYSSPGLNIYSTGVHQN